MEKWLILGQGQGTHKRSLEHLEMPGSKKVTQINKRMGPCQRDTTQEPNSVSSQSQIWNNLSSNVSNMASDYNLKYKYTQACWSINRRLSKGERRDKPSLQKNSKLADIQRIPCRKGENRYFLWEKLANSALTK